MEVTGRRVQRSRLPPFRGTMALVYSVGAIVLFASFLLYFRTTTKVLDCCIDTRPRSAFVCADYRLHALWRARGTPSRCTHRRRCAFAMTVSPCGKLFPGLTCVARAEASRLSGCVLCKRLYAAVCAAAAHVHVSVNVVHRC